jgi:hypothetical protein
MTGFFISKMIKFKEFISEQKNTHMEHAEDDVLNGGIEGTRNSINALRAVRDMLAGNSDKKVSITVKWDGAPAIFAGTDPSDKRFFVAKKGVFNKNPKVYKTDAEIDADTSGDLAVKLKACLAELPALGIDGVIQGDLLFTQADLKTVTIDGEEYVTFHPNTIVYAVPANSDLAEKIKRAKIGVVWHTQYEGKSFEDMKAVFGRNILTKLLKTDKVWSTDVDYKDVSGKATLTREETEQITRILSEVGKIFYKTDANVMNHIRDNDDMKVRIKAFNNAKVKSKVKITDARKHTNELIKHFEDYYDAEISKKKTPAAKKDWTAKKTEAMKFFKGNKLQLQNIFKIMSLLSEAKLILVKKLDEVQSLNTFLKTNRGYEVTGVEGYVAIDHLSGRAVKLVDRMQFSYANFSPDVIKGWQR